MAHVHKRKGYEGVALAVPITVPYERYSIRGAHWFVGQAVHALLAQSGLAKEQIDGLTVSSFSLAPDTAVGVTQHLATDIASMPLLWVAPLTLYLVTLIAAFATRRVGSAL